MSHPITLPAGTEARWQYAHFSADHALWDEFSAELLKDASHQPQASIKDDLALLALVACCRADDCDPAVPFCLDQIDLLEAA